MFEGFWERINRERSERRAAVLVDIPNAAWLVSAGEGGYYVDADGVPIGVCVEVPGRLDSNECLRACENATRARLTDAGYIPVGMW